MQGIYEIVNMVDSKASTYVGSSVNIERRWQDHRYRLRTEQHNNAHLQAAWNLYGEDAFAFGVLEEVGDDMLLAMEQEYLDDYFDRGSCYNIKATADGTGPPSEETRRKLSKAGKGRAPWNKGKKGVSEETSQKLSKAGKGRETTEATRQKIERGT